MKKMIFCFIIPIILAIPCLAYSYLRLFNPIIAHLTPNELMLRLGEGQKSLNYVIYKFGKPAGVMFAYVIILLSVLIFSKLKMRNSYVK